MPPRVTYRSIQYTALRPGTGADKSPWGRSVISLPLPFWPFLFLLLVLPCLHSPFPLPFPPFPYSAFPFPLLSSPRDVSIRSWRPEFEAKFHREVPLFWRYPGLYPCLFRAVSPHFCLETPAGALAPAAFPLWGHWPPSRSPSRRLCLEGGGGPSGPHKTCRPTSPFFPGNHSIWREDVSSMLHC